MNNTWSDRRINLDGECKYKDGSLAKQLHETATSFNDMATDIVYKRIIEGATNAAKNGKFSFTVTLTENESLIHNQLALKLREDGFKVSTNGIGNTSRTTVTVSFV